MRASYLYFLVTFLLLTSLVSDALGQLRSGPMLGYNTMREVAIWVQTERSSSVRLRYWPLKDVRDIYYTDVVQTSSDKAFCATLIADSLLPGQQYEYQVLIDERAMQTYDPLRFETQPLWAFRTDPPEFRIAMGSCLYVNEKDFDRPGKPYGSDYQILTKIDSLRPTLMLWLGDNNYLRPGDFQSKSGVFHRYTHTRSLSEMNGLLKNTHHLAIWDDHDFGPNDSDRSYIHRDWTKEAFDLFWANPPSEIAGLDDAITTGYRYGDVEFFMLDNRTYRAPNKCKTCIPKPLLGKDQIDWLIDALVSSNANYKFVMIGGQVLNNAPVYENYSHHHSKEREQLIDRIVKEGLKNVIFLTGDRHHTELSYMIRDGVELYDFTVSPLTSGAASQSKGEQNSYRVDGTWVGQRNFATIDVRGPYKSRYLVLRTYDAKGHLLWEKELK